MNPPDEPLGKRRNTMQKVSRKPETEKAPIAALWVDDRENPEGRFPHLTMSTQSSPMKNRTLTERQADNIILATADLAEVQERAKFRMLDAASITEAIHEAENFCLVHRVPKHARRGLLFVFDPWAAPAISYGALLFGTVLNLEFVVGVWKVTPERAKVGKYAKTLKLLKAPREAAIASAKTIFGVELR